MKKITMDNMDKFTTKFERKSKKIMRKMKILAILVGSILAFGIVFWGFYSISRWYDENKVIFQYPVIFQAPIKIERRNKQVKNNATMPVEATKKVVVTRSEFEIVNAQKHGQILWKIYQLESQRGLTDSCRKSGAGFGGFGVMNAGEVICYESFEKAVERAEYWFAKLEPEKSLVSALCQWQSGTPNLVNCMYYQNFLSL